MNLPVKRVENRTENHTREQKYGNGGRAVYGLASIRACSCRTNTEKELTPENGINPIQ